MASAFTRRKILVLGASGFAYLVGGKLAYGSRVTAEAKRWFETSAAASMVRGLPRFRGIFIVTPELLRPFADDFGHSVHKTPLGVLKPADAGDIQDLTRYCRARGLRLSMRGTGGAAYGQTQLDDGIIIDSSSLSAMKWLSDDRVECGPGCIWKDVLDFTIRKNRTPPVLADTLVTSVGGKANAGGIGETSYNSGAIVDHIVEFDLVLPDGSLRTCSPTENGELFGAALGTMGQLGFMTRIVLRTVPAPATVESR